MPTVLPLFLSFICSLVRSRYSIKLFRPGSNGYVGLDMLGGGPTTPGRVFMILVGFRVNPGGEEKCQVRRGRGMSCSATSTVLGVHEEEREEERCEQQGCEEDLQSRFSS